MRRIAVESGGVLSGGSPLVLLENDIDQEDLPVAQADLFRPGMTGIVRLEARPEPMATRLALRFTRFINRLMQES